MWVCGLWRGGNSRGGEAWREVGRSRERIVFMMEANGEGGEKLACVSRCQNDPCVKELFDSLQELNGKKDFKHCPCIESTNSVCLSVCFSLTFSTSTDNRCLDFGLMNMARAQEGGRIE